ncbi:hypothetical protein [Candidatus Ichthyocystis hellenicum]|uniref:hypothetical protein n=1 Tax=Candidatus Ichthyocystis hellenicum TaxID=1561003 RepID=UPI0012FE0628|nr:hypothetical protein [Candidatus Ichthyocystis hellenicum]
MSNYNVEHQSNNEVAEEGELTTVILTKQEKDFRTLSNYSSLNTSLPSRSLVNNFMATSLAIISTLESVKGENGSNYYIRIKLCDIGKYVCRILAVDSNGITRGIVKDDFDEAVDTIVSRRKESAFSFSFPLRIPRNFSRISTDESDLIGQLIAMEKYFIDEYESHEPYSNLTNKFCISESTEFCDGGYYPRIENFVTCCNSISEYIGYPEDTDREYMLTQSTTMEPNTISTAITLAPSTTNAAVTELILDSASEIIKSTTVDTDTINTAITLASSTTNSAVKELILDSTSEIIKSTTMVPEATNSTTAVVTSSVMKATSMAPEVIDQTTGLVTSVIDVKYSIASFGTVNSTAGVSSSLLFCGNSIK